MIGKSLGPYQVVAKLGEGGMGEVYRARDTKLGRDVALKILPDAFALDPDRLMRFEREAKTLASLNHPHIAQIYGFEDGPADAGHRHRALVMELVEGEDLAERLAQGALPLDEALPIARQIAEALEAAHDAGIIHRDLKPANIKLRSDGTVKVLDFGLAKPGGTGTATDARLDSPTITSPAMTMQGMILGTAAYMAPEQAKGRAVDKRADIWAFGCVLYEMLTGRRAFDGEDVSDTMAAILRGEPEWTALSDAPPAVVTLVKRCLERDPRRRLASMSAVRYVLDDPQTAAPARSAIAAAPAPVESPRSRTALVAVAALAVGAIVGALAMRGLAPSAIPRPVVRFQLPLPEGQVLAMARRMMALSPDGTELAYITETQLFTRRLSEFDASPISPAGVGRAINLPTYSPDGGWLAFYSVSEGAVMRVSTRGGSALRVCQVAGPTTLSWDTTGILLGMGSDGILRCSPTGGSPEVLVKAQPGEMLFSPQTLPGGDHVLVTVAKLEEEPPERWNRAQLAIQSLATGERRTVVNGGSDSLFLPSGHILYGTGGILFAVPFDLAALEVRGDPVPVVEGVMRSTTGPMHVSLSASGTLAYVPGPTGAAGYERELAIADRSRNLTTLPLPAGAFVHVRASRDGARLVLGTDDGKDAIVWVYALDGKSAIRRLTLDGKNRAPIWSPDGQWIAFESERASGPGIYRQRADGTGAAERLTTSGDGETHTPESWSPDGRYLSYAVRKNTSGGVEYSLWMFSLPDRRATAFGLTSTQPIGSVFSPDGRWIAYTQSPSEEVSASNRGVFVQPFPATGAAFQAPRQLVDFHPIWTPDGKEIVFLASTTAMQMAAVRVSGADSLTFGTPTRFPATVTGDQLSNTPRVFDILPDGRFVGVIPRGDNDMRGRYREVRVVLNWTDELAGRLAPK